MFEFRVPYSQRCLVLELVGLGLPLLLRLGLIGLALWLMSGIALNKNLFEYGTANSVFAAHFRNDDTHHHLPHTLFYMFFLFFLVTHRIPPHCRLPDFPCTLRPAPHIVHVKHTATTTHHPQWLRTGRV